MGVDDDSVRDELALVLKPSSGGLDIDKWTILYSSYLDRYHRDSDRTWSTATWLVGVAWTLFPAVIALDAADEVTSAGVFAAASVALVLLWLAIATTHRVWASRSFKVVRALERVMLDEPTEISPRSERIREALKRHHPTPRALGGHPIQRLRVMILVGTVSAWAVMLWLVQDGVFKTS